MLGGVLNSLYRFSSVAATPMILNISLILSLELISHWTETPAHALGIGVSLGGILQLIWLLVACERAGIKLKLRFPRLTTRVKKLILLAAPAAIGAGVAQINLLIDIIIASFLPEGSVSFLYYADRVSQLPLGVVGVAVGTALLPLLSRQLRSGDFDEVHKSQNSALRGALLLTIPATVALIVLAEPLIITLFERGEFTSSDSVATANALLIYAIGLPAFVLIKVFVPAFFAREDTKTPLYISIVSVITNIVLSLLLIGSMREMGIALATAISAWVNTVLLFIVLRRNKYFILDSKLIINTFKIAVSVILMAFGCYFLNLIIFANIQDLSLLLKIGSLLLILFCCNFLYLGMIFMLKVLTIQDLKGYIQK